LDWASDDWASNGEGVEPDLVLACAGDVATMESLARGNSSEVLSGPQDSLRQRSRLIPVAAETEHLMDLRRDFDTLFTTTSDIFNFHSYPWLIHKLTYRRTNHDICMCAAIRKRHIILAGLAIANQVDRFSCR